MTRRAPNSTLPLPSHPMKRTNQLHEIAKWHGFSAADLIAQNRSKSVSRARHVAMYCLRRSGMKGVDIAAMLGRDHSTVLHGVARIEAARAEDDELNAQLHVLEQRTKGE